MAARLGPFILAFLAVLSVLLCGEPGLTWDEPEYCYSGAKYASWISRVLDREPRAMTFAGISEALRPNHEHPPLARVLYGEAIWHFGRWFGLLKPARAVATCCFAAMVFVTVRVGGRLFGATAGLASGGVLLLMPRLLAHAQLAELDMPAALMGLLAASYFLRGPLGWKGAALGGFLWGLALLTKVNGVFLIAPILAWGLGSRNLRAGQVPLVLAVGAATFFAGWPWLWPDPPGRLHEYLLDKVARWVVPTFYLGRTYSTQYPPWHFPLVMTAVTIPPATLAALLAGTLALVRRRSGPGAWLGLNLAFTLGLACCPGVPRYDGTRLFMTAVPFLALLAGLGFDLVLRGVAAGRLGRAGAAALALLVAGPTVARMRSLDPCLLSYYSSLVGGLKGAERLGFETTYWGDALTPALLEGACKAVRAGTRVAVAPMSHDYLAFLTLEGILRDDAVWGTPDDAELLLLSARRGMLTPALRLRLDREPGWLELRREGVVLAKAYLRQPRSALAPPPRP